MLPPGTGSCPCNYITLITRADQFQLRHGQEYQQEMGRRHQVHARPADSQPGGCHNPMGTHDIIPWTASRHLIGKPGQILSAERRPARGDHHKRVRRHHVSPRRRHADQLPGSIHKVDLIRMPRLQPLHELKRLPGQRMKLVRHPHPARWRLTARITRSRRSA
jgi:hypothetical protein